jgi:hypothetical protein
MDVVEHLDVGGADQSARDVGVDLVVHVYLEGWEEAAYPVVVAVVATAGDIPVDVEAEEREAEVQDVVHVANDDLIAPLFYGDGAPPRNADLTVVGEGDVLVVDTVVVDEGLVKGPEVVGGALRMAT